MTASTGTTAALRFVSSAPSRARSRGAAIVLLIVCSVVSLAVITTVDAGAYIVLHRYAAPLAWIAEARVTAFVACLACYLLAERLDARRVPTAAVPWRQVSVVAVLWVVGTGIADFVVGVFLPALPRRVDLAAFLVFGLAAEELLFRGVLFQLTERVSASRLVAVTWTALLFSLQHLQYHDYHVTRHALTQVAYTLPMGLAFGYLRGATRRLWPSVGLHVLTNALAIVRIMM